MMGVLKVRFVAFAFVAVVALAPACAESVDRLMGSLRSYTQENRSRSRLAMDIVRKDRVTEYELSVWNKDGKFLSRVESPSSDKGTMYLSANGNSWIYYPSIEKTIRTSATQKLLGGDFSLSEITGLDYDRDYDLSAMAGKSEAVSDPSLSGIVPEGVVESISATAKKGVKVSYPKVVISFDAQAKPLMEEFFTVSGQRLGVVVYRDFGELGGKQKAREIVAYTTIKKDEYSRIKYTSLDTGAKVDDVLFTVVYLPKASGGK